MNPTQIEQKNQTINSEKFGKGLIFTGNFNTAHNEIDLKNPEPNLKQSGFLPVEQQVLNRMTHMGYVDTFRYFHPETVKYSWQIQSISARLIQGSPGTIVSRYTGSPVLATAEAPQDMRLHRSTPHAAKGRPQLCHHHYGKKAPVENEEKIRQSDTCKKHASEPCG